MVFLMMEERKIERMKSKPEKQIASPESSNSNSSSGSNIGKTLIAVAAVAAIAFGGMQIFGGNSDGMTYTSPAVAVLAGQMQTTPAKDVPAILDSMNLLGRARLALEQDIAAGKITMQHFYLQIPGGGTGTTSLGSFTTTKTLSGNERVRFDVPVPATGGQMRIQTNGKSTAYFRNGSVDFTSRQNMPVYR